MTAVERGDNTAQERAALAQGLCPQSGERLMPNGNLRPACAICDCGDEPAPAADRQTDEKRDAASRAACLANWPDAENGAYNPYCCRWPKSCSVPPAARPAHADAVMADLGAAITEGVTEARLREVLRKHHPTMRSETGALKGCRCGGVQLGQDVIAHVVGHLLAALDGEG